MTKSILILLTWPLGIYVSWMVFAEGITQDPFALAVHEMLFMLICVVLMLLSVIFSNPISSDYWVAIRHTAYYLCIAVFSSFMIFIFVLIPYSQHGIYGGRNTLVIGISVLSFIILIGAVHGFRNLRTNNKRTLSDD